MRRGWKRNIGIVLAVSVIFGNIPVYGAAPARVAGGLCEHHPEHTADCGYKPGMPGTPCSHEHTEDCYVLAENCVHEHTDECYPVPEEEGSFFEEADSSEKEEIDLPKQEEAPRPEDAKKEPTECEHVCSEESGCIKRELDCPHEREEHDETCGYVPAEPGTPCSYVCEICRSQEETEGGETDKTEHIDKPDSIDKTEPDSIDKTEKEEEKSQENQPEDKKPGNTGTKDALESDNKPEEEKVSTSSDALEMTPEQMKAMKSVLAVENPVASVTIDGVKTEYASLGEAINAADGHTATITLLQSTSEDLSTVAVMSGNIALHLNGQSITNSSAGLIVLGGTVTITGEGTISYMQALNNGIVIVKGGHIEDLKMNSSQSITIEGGNIDRLFKENGTVTVKGGNIKTVYGTIDEYEINNISLDQTNLSLVKDQTGDLTATVTPNISAPNFPTWESSNTSVATVTGNGATATVTAISAGNATITVKAGDKTATCTVKVEEPQSSTVSVSITGTGVTENNGTYSAIYGSDITVIAIIAAASTNAKARAAAKNTVDFYLDSITGENKLNEKPIAVTDNKATLTLPLTGEKWKAGTTYTILADFGGSDALKESSGTAQLTITPAPIVGMISISGDAVPGGTLTANYTSLTGESVSYQWNLDSENIPGATEATYVVADSDVGKKITVTVTASDANHTGELTSASVTVGQAEQLATPQNVVLKSAKPGSAAVSWSAVANAQSYSVQLYKDGKLQGSPVSVKDGTAHTFENITEAGSYTVRVIAKGAGNYADSQEAESCTLSFYPVTFEMDGGSSISRQIVAAGGKVDKPAEPVKTGYTFSGWYRENSFSVSWNFDADTVSQAVTLYAKWMKPEDSGGSGDSSSSGSSSGGTSAGSGGSSSGSSSSASVYVPENGTWEADETGWRFEKKEGGYPADAWYECVWNGKKYWYHFNAAGYLDSGWFTDKDGNSYFLHDLHDGSFGYLYTGWHWIEGKCYYFTPNTIAGGAKQGMLYKNGITPDGYSVNETGAWTVNGVVQMKYYFLIQ